LTKHLALEASCFPHQRKLRLILSIFLISHLGGQKQ
jgi:hypothetical protein